VAGKEREKGIKGGNKGKKERDGSNG